MRSYMRRIWKDDDGVLTFEWILLVTLLTIGIVGGLANARDAVVDELGDVAQAMLALDQSYSIDFPLLNIVHAIGTAGGSDSEFTDAFNFSDCNRATIPSGQGQSSDSPS